LNCRTNATRTANKVFCDKRESEFNEIIGKLDPYGLDFDVCGDEPTPHRSRTETAWLLSHVSSWHLNILSTFEPCEGNFMNDYLNKAEVKAAIHAKADIDWYDCAYGTYYDKNDTLKPMMGYYNKLIDGGYKLKILVYSGDDDTVCATSGTQDWIWSLGYKHLDLWQTWTVDQQVAGYATRFDGQLTFVTVHGAGHMVPQYLPVRGFELFKRYLDDTWFKPQVIVLT